MRSPILLLSLMVLAAAPVFSQAAPPAKPAETAVSTQARENPPLTEGQLLERKGDVQMARKLYREAIDSYGSLVRKEPNNWVAWNKMGIAHHQLLQLGAARNFYERSVRINKNYAEAINNLGTIYYAQKNYKKAIRMYEKALEISPNSASIYSNLGTAYFARKKDTEAFAAYRKALELDPEVFEHRSSYGVLLQERSVEDRARYHFFLAQAYASSGNLEKSIEYLRKALEEGFKETKKIYEDPAFAELVKTAPFTELMSNPPAVLPR